MLGDRRVGRIGFGAMQLAGPGVFGPPRDRDAALAVLRRAVQLGVDHIGISNASRADVEATASQVALAWLLHRDERILLIPGTSSVAHLEENLAAGEIVLDAEDLAALDDVRPAGDPLAAVGRE